MSTFSDYLDLHINLEQIPDYTSIQAEFTTQQNYTKFAARFLQKLQQSISSNNKQDLLTLYEGDYAWGIKTYPPATWVEAHIIEQACDIEINLISQAIYNELVYRLDFERLDQNENAVEFIDKVWNNYQSIFEDLKQPGKVNLTEGWICDILDNFVGQFEIVCEWRSKAQNEKEAAKIEGWTVAEIRKALTDLYQHLTQNNKLKLPEELNSIDLFGYFALINHLKLETLLSNYSAGINLIQNIMLNHTIIFSKAFSAQMNLFYYSSYCYFMTEKYLESVKLIETIAIFFESYKAFIKESLNEKKLVKLNEKILVLWCLGNIFEGNQSHDLITGILEEQYIITKERNYEEFLIDKHEKLSQFDHNTFLELFNFAHVKRIDEKTLKVVVEDSKEIEGKFESLKKINLNTILKLYSRIELSKMARFLGLKEEDLKETLKGYGQSKASLMQTPWEKTILQSLLKFEGECAVEIRGDIVHIERGTEKKAGKDYGYLLNGIGDIAKNLGKI